MYRPDEEGFFLWMVCDWCGKEIPRSATGHDDEWTVGIQPHGGYAREMYFEVCPDCGKELMGLIRGIINERDSDKAGG